MDDSSNNNTKPATGRFRDLHEQLLEGARARSINYWQDRLVSTTVHEDFLAVSWSGDIEYKLAQAFEKALRRAKKPADDQRSSLSQRARSSRELAKELRERYKTRQDRRYAYECYVFFKSSEIGPESLLSIAPTLLPAFYAAPLHHYFVIMRHQPVADREDDVTYTAWSVLNPSMRTSRQLVDDFLERMFPAKTPIVDGPENPEFWRKLIIFSTLIVAIIAFSASIWVWQGGFDQFLSSLNDEEAITSNTPDQVPVAPSVEQQQIDGIERRLSLLDEAVTDVQTDLGTLASRITDEAAIGPDFRVSDDQIQDFNEAISGAVGEAQRSGLDLPPCLPVSLENGRHVPTYLFTAILGDSGISIIPRNSAQPDITPYHERLPYLGRTVTTSGFREGSETVFAESLENNCRHYVLLMEANDATSLGNYIEMRQAVETNFYIYRIRNTND